MRGSAGLYVTTNGTTSLEALGLSVTRQYEKYQQRVGTVLLGNYYPNHEQGDMF